MQTKSCFQTLEIRCKYLVLTKKLNRYSTVQLWPPSVRRVCYNFFVHLKLWIPILTYAICKEKCILITIPTTNLEDQNFDNIRFFSPLMKACYFRSLNWLAKNWHVDGDEDLDDLKRNFWCLSATLLPSMLLSIFAAENQKSFSLIDMVTTVTCFAFLPPVRCCQKNVRV